LKWFQKELALLQSRHKDHEYALEETAAFKMLVINAIEKDAPLSFLRRLELQLEWPSKTTVSGWVQNYRRGILPINKRRTSRIKGAVESKEKDIDTVDSKEEEIKKNVADSLVSLSETYRAIAPFNVAEGSRYV
jgi:hypothetical protein